MSYLFSPSRAGFFIPGIHDPIPADAVPVTAERHAALLAGQAAGQRIVAGPGGAPVLADPPPPSAATLATRARAERDRRLAACDWTQLADAPLSAAQRTAWATYRAALRALPDAPGWPAVPSWPAAPG